MKKTKIYLDTSVINYLDAPHMPQHMQDTVDLWECFVSGERFEVVISEVVEREILACSTPKRDILVNRMAEVRYSLIRRTSEILDLTNCYVEFGVLSKNNLNDLSHIAHATVSGCKLILSWNFKHFVNYKTMDRVNAVNLLQGYDAVRIASPSMIMGELANE